MAELDLEAVLELVVAVARDLTDAEYAALGVLDADGNELERFIYLGIDEETRRAIGPLPRGRGVLGELIRSPQPLRVPDVNAHPHAYGFPPGHPPMRSFLGVPITIRGEAYGNLYMTEKRGAFEFDEDDEEAATTLAAWAAIAIENARLYTSLREREADAAQALKRAESSADIARAVGGETDVSRVLDLIVKRARALVEARTVLVLMQRGENLVVLARAGQGDDLSGLEFPLEDAAFQAAMRERVAQHLEPGSPPSEARLRERVGAEAALVVPLLFRGRAVGALVALDREVGGADFDEEDLRLLQAFAGSAATAIGTAQMVRAERLQQQVEVADEERRRWARELHDGALQGLAAIRITLAGALQVRSEDAGERLRAAVEGTIESVEAQITELSRLIDDLRPAPLERLGLAGAIESLAAECGNRGGFEVETDIELDEGEISGDRERAIYRLAQEALNNIVKHANAERVAVWVRSDGGAVRLRIEDDGEGFEPSAGGSGRGLVGMRERTEMLGGELVVSSKPGQGMRLAASVPLVEGEAPARRGGP